MRSALESLLPKIMVDQGRWEFFNRIGGKWTFALAHSYVICRFMAEDQEKEAWMALLHVRPLPGHTNALDGASGMGWVLALAGDADHYLRLVKAEMESIGLFIAEVEDLERWSAFDSCAEHIVDSKERLSEEWPVQYHTFHTTMIDDA